MAAQLVLKALLVCKQEICFKWQPGELPRDQHQLMLHAQVEKAGQFTQAEHGACLSMACMSFNGELGILALC